MASNVIPRRALPTLSRVYVSGPISGIPRENVDAFAEATRRLRAAGYHAVDPHEINAAWRVHMRLRGFDPEGPDYLRRDLVELMQCDAILLLPGWEDSVGARCEIAVAFTLGLVRMRFDDGDGFLGEWPPDRVVVHHAGYRAAPGPVPAEGGTDVG